MPKGATQLNVSCLCAKLALGNQGSMYVDRVQYHISHIGPEATVKRYKAIKVAAELLKEGSIRSRNQAFRLMESNRIKFDPSSGIPKGPEGIPVKKFLDSDRPSVLRRMSTVMKCYNEIRLSAPSRTQVSKLEETITSTSEHDLARYEAIQAIVKHHKLTDHVPPEVMSLASKCLRECTDLNELRPFTSSYAPHSVPKEFRDYPYAKHIWSLMSTSWLPEVPGINVRANETRMFTQANDTRVAGKIAILQEGGCKPRTVAVPNAWIQLAFKPLQNCLDTILQSVPESCVHDQDRGARFVVEHLNRSKSNRIYCVDLSSATDRFPRQLQTDLLKNIGLKAYAEGLEQVSTALWVHPTKPDRFLSYAEGQPMGLYGSFPLFTLSHILVAREAERLVRSNFPERGVKGFDFRTRKDKRITHTTENSFFVIGDDIVFADPKVATAYQKLLKGLHVPFSREKTFSGRVGEFAGYHFTSSRSGVIAYKPYKCEGQVHPLNLMRSLGFSVSKLNGNWPDLIRKYQATSSFRGISGSPLFNLNEQTVSGKKPEATLGYVRDLSTAMTTKYKNLLPENSGPDTHHVNTLPLVDEHRGKWGGYANSIMEWAKDKVTNLSLPDHARRSHKEDELYDPYIVAFRKPNVKIEKDQIMKAIDDEQHAMHDVLHPLIPPAKSSQGRSLRQRIDDTRESACSRPVDHKSISRDEEEPEL